MRKRIQGQVVSKRFQRLSQCQRYEFFRAFYSASDHDVAADHQHYRLWDSGLQAVACERPACSRLPRDSGQRDLSGSEPGNDGKYVCDAARKAIPPDPGLRLSDIDQSNRSIDLGLAIFFG